jgi:AraC-like DNA-binding protein
MSRQQVGTSVSVRFFLPSAELTPYISTYYLTEVRLNPGETIQDWLHPEWANLRFARNHTWSAGLGEQVLDPAPFFMGTGPTSRAAHFATGSMYCWGIGLLPLGWARFAEGPAEAYADRVCDGGTDPAYAGFAPLLDILADDVRDPASEAARINAHFLAMLGRRPEPEDAARIRAAHAALLDPGIGTVAQLAERLAMSPRSFERLSTRAFGFAPKLLLRRQRFMRSLAQFMLDPSLKWIGTLDWFYVDQAHFVRDFKRFMGMSPSKYAALDHPVMRAAAQARSVAAGAAVQTLHSP